MVRMQVRMLFKRSVQVSEEVLGISKVAKGVVPEDWHDLSAEDPVDEMQQTVKELGFEATGPPLEGDGVANPNATMAGSRLRVPRRYGKVDGVSTAAFPVGRVKDVGGR